MRARVGAGAIGFVATISSGLRVLQRLEPITNIMRDMFVLAIVAGNAKGWTSELCGENDNGNKAGWDWMKLRWHTVRPKRARTGSCEEDHNGTIPQLIEGSGKFLAFRCWSDSDGGMIRGGFLGEEDRNKLIALARDGAAASRMTRRANALVLLDDGWSCREVASRQGVVARRRHDPRLAQAL